MWGWRSPRFPWAAGRQALPGKLSLGVPSTQLVSNSGSAEATSTFLVTLLPAPPQIPGMQTGLCFLPLLAWRLKENPGLRGDLSSK